MRAIKNEASESEATNLSSQHPDVSELASFFYSTLEGVSSQVAGHVASCSSCAEEIAQYAAGERAASEYQVANRTRAEMPAKAWEMISEWEESSFAKLKPAGDVINRELLTRLAGILNERNQQADGSSWKNKNAQLKDTQRVPVLVVSRSGEVRSIEFFERNVDSTGTTVLRHAEGSARFDNKAVHTLFDIGEENAFVVSNLIRRDTIRLEQSRSEEESRHADYVIIED